MVQYEANQKEQASPSSRRAWIEILTCHGDSMVDAVALLAEGVDRNSLVLNPQAFSQGVALLAEGVDRNDQHEVDALVASVALLAEGVDRNRISAAMSSQERRRPPRGGRG